MKGTRSGVDFSKHILTISKTDNAFVHKFWQADTCCYGVTFINSQGVLAVTGDCGNWIFCREFHPSKDGHVSDSYWCEKLRISSTQNPYDFSEEKTTEEINDRLQDEDIDVDEKEYLERLLDYVGEGEFWYLAKAHDNLPDGYDHEYVPHGKELNGMLAVVFDAFDEICRQMKEGEL